MPFFDQSSRSDLRRMYLEAWRKHCAGLPLEPLEAQIADVMGEHPEYFELLNDPETALTKDFSLEAGVFNPFLHMAMHLAIRDQVSTDRPQGIREIFATLTKRRGAHEAEHNIAEQLAEMIWQSQRNGVALDEQVYLRRVKRLTR